MIKKYVAAAAVGLVCLSGQAFAKDASAAVAKSAVVKAAPSKVVRSGAKMQESDKAFGAPLLLFIAFGVVTTVGLVAAFDDDDPSSP